MDELAVVSSGRSGALDSSASSIGSGGCSHTSSAPGGGGRALAGERTGLVPSLHASLSIALSNTWAVRMLRTDDTELLCVFEWLGCSPATRQVACHARDHDVLPIVHSGVVHCFGSRAALYMTFTVSKQ